MAFTAVVFCAFALLVQSICGQSIGCGCSYGSSGISSSSAGISSSSADISSGGGFSVTSISPISPSGISVAADIGLAGTLDVAGALPFLSAVEFQETMPTCGSGCVDYSCGCGDSVTITSVSGGSSGSLGGCGCGR